MSQRARWRLECRVAAVVIIAPVSLGARAETAAVTHVVAGSWQSSDFHDTSNPGCSVGASGSVPGGRLAMGASQRRQAPMDLTIRKTGWAIPPATSIQVRATFSDGVSIDLTGKGGSQVVQFDIGSSQLPSWVHELTANTQMHLQFAGSEPVWNFDLSGSSKAIDAMAECLTAHHIDGLGPPFVGVGAQETAATQPFGGALPATRPALSQQQAPPPPLPSAQETPSEPSKSAPQSDPPSAHLPREAEDCKKNWRDCRDNEDLVNNYASYYKVQSDCQTEGNKSARFGTPVWPGFWSGGSFHRFHSGRDYPKTGVVIAIEADAQFQNGFGAMVHSTVICKYDLNTETIISVDVLPN